MKTSQHSQPSLEQSRVPFMGIPLHPWTMDHTLGVIEDRIRAGQATQHVVLNVAKIVNMKNDSILHDSVVSCDIINVDGQGVVWGAKFLGVNIPERVAGIDLMMKLLALCATKGFRPFLLGAREDVLQEAVTKLKQLHPKLELAGAHHGYFWDDEEAVVDLISKSRADMLFVAITSPRKENFINRWQGRLNVNFVMGVGGSFDVLAGATKRAPLWFQKNGLEWLYRLIQEPRRMWKRYLLTNSKFALMLIKAKLFSR